MPIKQKWIQVRINEKEKKDWEKFATDNKFPSVSQLVRFAVNEIIEKGITTSADIGKFGKNAIDKDFVKGMVSEWKEERKEFFQKITELYAADKEAKSIEEKYKITERVLKLLEKNKFKSEDIADIFGLPESDIVSILNDLIDKKIVIFNKKMEYMLVEENGNNN